MYSIIISITPFEKKQQLHNTERLAIENEHSEIRSFFLAYAINNKVDTAFLPEQCDRTPPITYCFVLPTLLQNQGNDFSNALFFKCLDFSPNYRVVNCFYYQFAILHSETQNVASICLISHFPELELKQITIKINRTLRLFNKTFCKTRIQKSFMVTLFRWRSIHNFLALN